MRTTEFLTNTSDYSTRTTMNIGEVHFRAEGDVTVYLIECSGNNEVKLINHKESSRLNSLVFLVQAKVQ